MKTVTELRNAFWATHEEFKSEYRKSKRQNDYNATIRAAWVDYVDSMAKDGQITRDLANRAIL